MKSNVAKNAICFAIFLTVLNLAHLNAQKTASLSEVLKQVTEALKEVETKVDMPKPEKVSVTFETEVSTESAVGLKVLIFKIGKKWQKAKSNEVTYNFDLNPTQKLASEPIKEALTKAIKNAYEELSKINNTAVRLTGFSLKVSFVIERSTDTGGEIELSPITPELGKSWKKKAVHTIEIEFAAK